MNNNELLLLIVSSTNHQISQTSRGKNQCRESFKISQLINVLTNQLSTRIIYSLLVYISLFTYLYFSSHVIVIVICAWVLIADTLQIVFSQILRRLPLTSFSSSNFAHTFLYVSRWKKHAFLYFSIYSGKILKEKDFTNSLYHFKWLEANSIII